jgi:hypothetical protein
LSPTGPKIERKIYFNKIDHAFWEFSFFIEKDTVPYLFISEQHFVGEIYLSIDTQKPNIVIKNLV